MRADLLEILRCPRRLEALSLTPLEEGRREVRRGRLICEGNHDFEISDGIVRFATGFDHEMVRREIAYENASYQGTDKLTNRDLIARFPETLPELWPHAVHFGPDFRGLIKSLRIGPGSWVLDIGTASCWSTRLLAETGAHAIALDVNEADYYGLKAADFVIETHGVYFERILESMTHLPFRDGGIDAITFNASLHHTPDLRRTLRECYRVLKPGGQAAMINEPFCSIRHRLTHSSDEEQEGSHHSIGYREFHRALTEAGFSVCYAPAPHVRRALEEKLPRPVGRVLGRCLEAAPVTVQQLRSALIVLRKPDRGGS